MTTSDGGGPAQQNHRLQIVMVNGVPQNRDRWFTEWESIRKPLAGRPPSP